MNKLFLIYSILFVLLFYSCSSNNEKERFYNTYRQIAITRSEIPDTAIANKKVMEIIHQNGYTEEEFRKKFFELARSEKDFILIIDSLRNSVKNDYQKIIDSTKSRKNNIEE